MNYHIITYGWPIRMGGCMSFDWAPAFAGVTA